MDTRLEDLTKEQLIAELNVAKEKLKYYHCAEEAARHSIQLSPNELCSRLAIAEAKLAVHEEKEHREKKKVEFERRLAEATDFLNANGYEVVNMNEQGRQQIQPESPNSLKWTDDDMISFAIYMNDGGHARGYVNHCQDFFDWIKKFRRP
jgi:hypothetical protein